MALVQATPSLPVSSRASRNELVKRRQKCVACSRKAAVAITCASGVGSPSDEEAQVVAVGAVSMGPQLVLGLGSYSGCCCHITRSNSLPSGSANVVCLTV
jgi:hypothetical protein